jgi:ABC-type sulfate transport system permease subunit
VRFSYSLSAPRPAEGRWSFPTPHGGAVGERAQRLALTFGVAVALISGVTLGNGGANVMPVFVDDFATRFALSDSAAGLVAASQLMATAVVTLLLAKRAARPGR